MNSQMIPVQMNQISDIHQQPASPATSQAASQSALATSLPNAQRKTGPPPSQGSPKPATAAAARPTAAQRAAVAVAAAAAVSVSAIRVAWRVAVAATLLGKRVLANRRAAVAVTAAEATEGGAVAVAAAESNEPEEPKNQAKANSSTFKPGPDPQTAVGNSSPKPAINHPCQIRWNQWRDQPRNIEIQQQLPLGAGKKSSITITKVFRNQDQAIAGSQRQTSAIDELTCQLAVFNIEKKQQQVLTLINKFGRRKLVRKGREGNSLEDADFNIKEVKIEEMRQKKKVQRISATTNSPSILTDELVPAVPASAS